MKEKRNVIIAVIVGIIVVVCIAYFAFLDGKADAIKDKTEQQIETSVNK